MAATDPAHNSGEPSARPVQSDALLECLVVLTRLFGRPQTRAALQAGLPFEGEAMTPPLMIRAAQRAGISARVRELPLDAVSDAATPVVLLLKDGGAWVATHIDREKGVAEVVQAESGGHATVTLDALERRYDGTAIFARPEYRMDERADVWSQEQSGHWFWGAFRRSFHIYRDVIVASVMLNFFILATPFFILNVYDRVVPNNATETLWVLASGVVIVYVFELVIRGLRAYFIDVAGRRTDVEVSNLIFERVLGLKSSARPASVGAFTNNLHAFERVREFITSTTLTTLVDMPFAALFLFVIYLLGGVTVLPPLLGIPVIIIYGLLIQPPLRAAIEKSFRASAQKNATLVEGLSSIEAVKTLGAEGTMLRRWEQGVDYQSHWGIRSRLLSNSMSNVGIFLRHFALAGVVVVGVYQIGEGNLSVGGLIACVILTRHAMAPVGHFASLAARYHQAKTAYKTLDKIMQLPVERPTDKSFVYRENFDGDVRFSHVTFSYPAQTSPALSDVSLHIRKGERVGIIGPMGSGKTTLAKLVLGLYEADEGQVTVDGIETRQIDPVQLRRAIGYVPQDVSLFYGTVRENITMGAPSADDEMMVRAARIAGVMPFVNKNPRGFDMRVGERGAGLSGGQRQSIAIARAMLMDPPILLLDEPSNSIDHRTEMILKKNLAQSLGGRTVIVITHHTSMLELVDRLIVLEEGRVVADGPKAQVLEALRKGSIGGEPG